MGTEPQEWLDLVERLQQGDRVALARVTALITAYLTRFGAYDQRDAWDDVCQEVLIKLIRSVRAGTLRNPSAFVGFVGSVTRNSLIDWIRKHAKPGAADDSRDGEPGEPQVERLPADLGRTGSPDLMVDLERAVGELPEAQRRAVGAIYLEGRSYEEAAEQLGIPLGTLKHYQTQGLRALRARMGSRETGT